MKTMIGAAEAHALVLEHAKPIAPKSIWAVDSAGFSLAQPVVADRDYPPFDRATMDGYAVRLEHAGRSVVVRGEARPGLQESAGPDADACVEIMTGAPCPPGTEAVVMKEQVTRDPQSQGTEPRSRVLLPATVASGQNIVRIGSECKRGDVVLPEGAVMTSVTLGLLAAVGADEVSARKVNVAVLITGDEVVQSVDELGRVQIRDSNGPMIVAMARAASVTFITLYNVKDTTRALAEALKWASDADVVVLTGGVSAGNYDLVPKAVADHGATIVFHKVRQQPGKPMLFAVKGPRLFFGLPGTPLGCHLGMFRYVVPALRALAGLPPPAPPAAGKLACSWSSPSDRAQFVLARVARDTSDASVFGVTPLVSKGSSDLFTPWSANAYVHIDEGTRQLAAGAEVCFQWLAP